MFNGGRVSCCSGKSSSKTGLNNPCSHIFYCFMSYLLLIILSPFALMTCSFFNFFPFFLTLSPSVMYFDDLKYTLNLCLIFSKLNILFITRCTIFFIHHPTTFYLLVNKISPHLSYITAILSLSISYFQLILLKCGDIEVHPGPVNTNYDSLSICHWNLNSIAAHNYAKMTLLEAYLITHNFDIAFLSETYLDSSFDKNDPRLNIPGYNLERCDHPDDIKQGGVCIFFKENLSLVVRKDLSILRECLVCEVRASNRKCFVTGLYRSPSQSPECFDNFKADLQDTLTRIENENPFISVVVGDFNARCSNWWPNDIDNACGIEIDEITSFFGLTEIISSPTHILPSSSSLIDLIFCSQPSLVSDWGVHPSLFRTCHHQIPYVTLNIKVDYPPSYERKVWHYGSANIDAIKRSLSLVNWEKRFHGKNVNEQVSLLNSSVLNVFENFVPNQTIRCNDKKPAWLTNEIKTALRKKNRVFKNYRRRGRNVDDEQKLSELSKSCTELIEHAKKTYTNNLSIKLNDPLLAPKTYWSILNRFLGKHKVPLIPPLLENGKFVTNFSDKANIFNNFFAMQCTTINNDSILPPFVSLTNKTLEGFDIKVDNIIKILNNLQTNKAHGWDGISAQMVKLCGIEISKPLFILFKNCLESMIFPDIWKKGHNVPVHKKDSKNLSNNYRPISLLPIFSKVFEKLIFDALYYHLHSNNLLVSNQSGFRPGDSCVYQLLSITHNIFSAFNCHPPSDVRGVFLDISKAFDKVWHEALIFKLRRCGIKGNFISLLESFLANRQQRVVLNG